MAPKHSSTKRKPPEPLMPASWDAPQVFRDRLGVHAGRQRLMQSDGQLLLVLHAPPTADETHRRGRVFWRNAEGRWLPASLAHGGHSVNELLDEYEAATEALDDRADTADGAAEMFSVLTELNPLARAARNLYGVLQEAREADRSDPSLIPLRDRAYSLNVRLELLQQETKHALDYLVALRAEEQAVSSARQSLAAHRLNKLVALFLPLATLGGVLGMNMSNGLEKLDARHAPLPIIGVLLVGLVMGLLLSIYVTRKK
ncbi:CorA-like Mg2+ transporter protein [Pseudobythopirellula maris]|uniref:CorA-like Mg2+ transporter protein n=1 Tax=Pseudobythopirellula maris TaxID=2527991 RepID=A0A5C5ZLU3_9BACT|nr:CorA family divalent cation transporter [Pseudobythopirellula maris]TWT88424.1 CorA-like Mg2+ transporter protein [Pseudobythopirellula maris]